MLNLQFLFNQHAELEWKTSERLHLESNKTKNEKKGRKELHIKTNMVVDRT